MLGAIVGDIAGSFREFTGAEKFPELGLLPAQNDIPKGDIKSFRDIQYGVTDDTILTCGTAHALMELEFAENRDVLKPVQVFAKHYRTYAEKYREPIGGFGSGFLSWSLDRNMGPYNSCGNGSAMRVSPVAYVGWSDEIVLDLAFQSAACTHNHPEGIKGAQVTALAIFLANHGNDWNEIKYALKQRYLSYEPISQLGHFDSVCPETMRLAFYALDESNNFTDAVLKAVTIPHGDSDTLGAIVGAIAEGLYGIPDEIKTTAESMLKIYPGLWDTYTAFSDAYCGSKK